MTESILLLDPRAVASSTKAKLKLGAITKQPANPLFSEEYFARPPKPWEARLDNVYPNVIYDDEDGLFKCWYKSFIYDGLSNRTPLAQRPQQAYGESEREEGLLYATSVDGIYWEKPALGLIDFEGSKANNLVMRRATHGLHAGGVLKDARDPDPARRYKFIHRNASARSMASCFSPDGLHWSQPIPWREHDAIGDCHNNAIWSPALERYICITRGWADGIRTVLRSESEDFIHWAKPFEIMRGLDAHDQIYSMPICLYSDLYIGLPSLFHKGDASAADWDTVDTELAISADSVNWRRICRSQSLIPRGEGEYPDGDYDCGCIYAAAPFVHDDKILIYYGGGNGRHNNWREGSLNLATLDLDRWAGYAPRATHDAAILETIALQLSGERLTLNAELGRGGWIRYALLDGGGAALAGFGFDDCLPVKRGGASCELRWRNSDIAMLKGRAARVVFNFQRATLYALNAALNPAAD
ncbi:MAG: hypothetical protein OXG23_06620 [Chloroflexi bacterium]|nr:hypothetical protein [Chloroflexota bacterium]